MSSFSETPPHSVESERIVLGSILLQPGVSSLIPLLKPEDFYDPTYREIFSAMEKVQAKAKECDFVLLANELSESKRISEIGGSAFLAELAASLPTTALGPSAVLVLKKKRQEREAMAVGHRIYTLGMEQGHASEIPMFMSQEAKRIAEILPSSAALDKAELLKELTTVDDKIPTGFQHMDWVLKGGFSKGRLYTFAGRPGTGKSSLLCNFAAKFIERGLPFHFISLEMQRPEIMLKILCCIYKITEEEVIKNAAALIETLDPNFTFTTGATSLEAIQASILASPAPVIIIDYLQLIHDPSVQRRVEEVSNITRMLKILAMETGKPIVTASQMSRAIETDKGNREPVLADLRESGSIEQDSDVVGFLWDPTARAAASPEEQRQRDAVAEAASFFEGKAPIDSTSELRIIFRKNRNGPKCYTEMLFTQDKSLMQEKSGTVALTAIPNLVQEMPF